ncbi:hypothetical protein THASP1DRAFT_28073 [Thamnocephalis sphaerospora]|uniref:Uncharacterized protein n=1 Tax=Thamnocephalis sphaerospora TaxID=78915 RepID=A0A4P9XV50_9FUNG|nr:hypothetical protein THASP1DRAFT_28073 [Thamnocephalis sphaerospora]|eukprot:RKP10133.1 hypothetical protein THASP1DRAFT_28073 [Thamnocephalis sphaerospora]
MNAERQEQDRLALAGETPVAGLLCDLGTFAAPHLALAHSAGRVEVLDALGRRVYRYQLSAPADRLTVLESDAGPCLVVASIAGELTAFFDGAVRWRMDAESYLRACEQLAPDAEAIRHSYGLRVTCLGTAWLPSGMFTNFASTGAALEHFLLVSSAARPDLLGFVRAGQLVAVQRVPAPVTAIAAGYVHAVSTPSAGEQVIVGCEDGAIYLVIANGRRPDVNSQPQRLLQFQHPISNIVLHAPAALPKGATALVACTTRSNEIHLARNDEVIARWNVNEWIGYVNITAHPSQEKQQASGARHASEKQDMLVMFTAQNILLSVRINFATTNAEHHIA